MTFLNLGLLFGSLAAIIPLAIYIFNRQQFDRVEWGAMHLLEDIKRKNRRRIRIERLLLLFVRMAIPALLALAMARPVLTGASTSLLGDAKSSTVFLLDNSYSMGAGTGDTSPFKKGKEFTKELLSNMPNGSEASVVLLGGGVRSMLDSPTSNLERVKKKLDELETGYGQADVGGGLKNALDILGDMNNPHREVIVISDFQRVSWSPEDTAIRRKLSEKIRELKTDPYITCYPVGEKKVENNIGITALDYSRLAHGKGKKLFVHATVQNFGKEKVDGLRLHFQVNDEQEDVTQISLGAGETRRVLFTHTFDTAGSHVLRVHTRADRLKADNAMSSTLKIWEQIPVLLVDGDPSDRPLKGETDFLKVALGPFGQKNREEDDLIKPTVVPTKELSEKKLKKSTVAVLANVESLNKKQLKAVRKFTERGGGLMVFPGDQADPAWYNKQMAGDPRLLPMKLISLMNAVEGGVNVQSESYTHPALQMFNESEHGDLSTIRATRWYRIGRVNEDSDQDVRILARWRKDNPFLVETSVKDGRVIMSSVPADSDWTNMPARPVYVPLMQQLVTYLTSTAEPPRNVQVGDPLVAFLPEKLVDETVTLNGPEDHSEEIEVKEGANRGVVRFTETDKPGVYTIKHEKLEEDYHFVVNASRAESDLERLSDEQIKASVDTMGGKEVSNASEYASINEKRRFGTEMWPMIALLVLGLLFIEIMLQQYIRGGTR